jgi:signal transduction histidine kinase
MIRTRFSVEEIEVKSTMKDTTNFIDVSTRWRAQEWVKYLYEHGTIVKVDNYKMMQAWNTVIEMTWELSEKKKLFALLKWSKELDKTFT